MNSHGSTTQFGETGTLVIWFVELFFCGGLVAFFMVFTRAAEPFCEECSGWYGAARRAGLALGADKRAVKDELDRGDMEALAHRAVAFPGGVDVIVLDQRRCPQCETAPTWVKVAHRKSEKKESVMLAGLVPAEQMRRFDRTVQRDVERLQEKATPAPPASPEPRA